MIKWTSEGSTWLPEFFVGIWTPGIRYNLKIYVTRHSKTRRFSHSVDLHKTDLKLPNTE